MKHYVLNFPKQLNEALHISKTFNYKPTEGVKSVLISGLGGSGIGGTIMAELVQDTCKVPVLVNKDYTLPKWVNEKTLVIISSYSGNTEETISVMQQALQQKAQIVCVTSGGKVNEIATQNNLPKIIIPGGNPPRTCLGYSLTQLFKVFSSYGLIDNSYESQLEKTIKLLTENLDAIKTEAQVIAKLLDKKITAIYSLSNEGVAWRFRQQINENSKMLCWNHVIPEMNHNELVGWTQRNENLAVVILRTSFDLNKNIARTEICKNIFAKYASSVTEIFAKGDSKLEQAIYLIHLTDWVSCYLSDLNGCDPIEVNIIDYLKSELAKS